MDLGLELPSAAAAALPSLSFPPCPMQHPFPLRASSDRSDAPRHRRAAGPAETMDAPLLAPRPPARGSLKGAADEKIEDAPAACCRFCLDSCTGRLSLPPPRSFPRAGFFLASLD